MSVTYSLVSRTAGEYVDLADWNHATHGVPAFGTAMVVSMLAVQPAPDEVAPDALLGRWAGHEITLLPDSGTDGDLAVDVFDDWLWVVTHLEDLSPAVMVMLARTGLDPLPTDVQRHLEAMSGDVFLNFARCALVSGYQPVCDLLDDLHGSRWVERYRERSAAIVSQWRERGSEPRWAPLLSHWFPDVDTD